MFASTVLAAQASPPPVDRKGCVGTKRRVSQPSGVLPPHFWRGLHKRNKHKVLYLTCPRYHLPTYSNFSLPLHTDPARLFLFICAACPRYKSRPEPTPSGIFRQTDPPSPTLSLLEAWKPRSKSHSKSQHRPLRLKSSIWRRTLGHHS